LKILTLNAAPAGNSMGRKRNLLIDMSGETTGILRKLHSFLHGLVYSSPPYEDDLFAFFDDIAWLKEAERMRKEALVFWSEASIAPPTSRTALSLTGKFNEKQSVNLPELDVLILEGLAGVLADEPCDLIFEPARQVAPVPGTGIGLTAPVITPRCYGAGGERVRSFVDPLEDLYEQVDAGNKPVKERSAHQYTDLYAVIMRMTMNNKPRE